MNHRLRHCRWERRQRLRALHQRQHLLVERPDDRSCARCCVTAPCRCYRRRSPTLNHALLAASLGARPDSACSAASCVTTRSRQVAMAALLSALPGLGARATGSEPLLETRIGPWVLRRRASAPRPSAARVSLLPAARAVLYSAGFFPRAAERHLGPAPGATASVRPSAARSSRQLLGGCAGDSTICGPGARSASDWRDPAAARDR